MWCSCDNSEAADFDYLCVECRSALWFPGLPVLDIRRSGMHTREVVWIISVETRYNRRWGSETYYWSETHGKWIEKSPYDEEDLWRRREQTNISRWAYD